MKFQVWYFRSNLATEALTGMLVPDPVVLTKTHVHLMDVDADSMEHVFMKMQGEQWSPNGEARHMIRAKNLNHTSMSVGDVLVGPSGLVYRCDTLGFKRVR